ncbi:hypothetical protein [Desulfogranum japonicum]|uniref:hypothetical protein n=1 Tax=Desulfogranum japonicum TaxID=231447 RepID=UPI00048FC8E4|nr:hypothetical protein [Desulfogranum japonicum]
MSNTDFKLMLIGFVVLLCFFLLFRRSILHALQLEGKFANIFYMTVVLIISAFFSGYAPALADLMKDEVDQDQIKSTVTQELQQDGFGESEHVTLIVPKRLARKSENAIIVFHTLNGRDLRTCMQVMNDGNIYTVQEVETEENSSRSQGIPSRSDHLWLNLE